MGRLRRKCCHCKSEERYDRYGRVIGLMVVPPTGGSRSSAYSDLHFWVAAGAAGYSGPFLTRTLGERCSVLVGAVRLMEHGKIHCKNPPSISFADSFI